MKKIIALLAFASLCACIDPEGATKALQDSGYTDIKITGYDMFSCSNDDFYCTGFTATGPSGRHVEGAVGAGQLLKGSTIRLK